MAVPLVPIFIGVVIAAVFRMLVAVGIGFIIFTYSIPEIYNFINSYFQTLPPEIMNTLGILRVDICITIMLSASMSKLAYKISATPLIQIG